MAIDNKFFMNTAKIIQTTDNRNSKLAIAHNALKKATGPKRTFSIEDYYDNGAEIEVNFYDQDENFGIDVLQRTGLLCFVNNFYNSTIDIFDGDFHGQYEDTASASDYLDNNMREVLKDFLNQKGVTSHV